MKSVYALAITLLIAISSSAQETWVYFGTYLSGSSKGIYVSRFDSDTGKLTEPQLAAETRNPSFLAVHPNRRFLYAVGEVDDALGQRAGAVTSFALDPTTGKLTAINQQTSGGTGPCHLSVDAGGRCLLVANYGSGSIAALPIMSDGSLAEAASVIQHKGSSVNPKRQAGPHAHCITPSPDNRFVFVCDLGMDKVLIYRFDPSNALLFPNDPAYAAVAHGAGPRHLAFSSDGHHAYVINEMALTITAFAYSSTNGAMFEEQNVSTVPADYPVSEKDSTAEIALHPNGKFVYASNRGPDSIAVFRVDSKTGRLTLMQNESTQGRTPRHFAIDPDGKWLLAENQHSNSVVVFAIDPASGKLKPAGQSIAIDSPVCALFVSGK